MEELYKEVKNIYQSSREAKKIFEELREKTFPLSKDTLVIVESQFRIFKTMHNIAQNLEMIGEIKILADAQQIVAGDSTIYFKTIKDCEDLEGKTFKKIIFAQ